MRGTAGHRAMGLGGDFAIVVGVELDAGDQEEQKSEQAKYFSPFPQVGLDDSGVKQRPEAISSLHFFRLQKLFTPGLPALAPPPYNS